MSEKSVAERLQVKHDRRLAIVDPPAGLADAIRAGHPLVEVEQADIVLLFVANRAQFDRALSAILPRLADAAILWLAYPKLTSSLAADLNRDVIHAAVETHGLATVSQIAIDSDWSAMRLKRVQ